MLSKILHKRQNQLLMQAQAAFAARHYDVAVIGGGPGGYTAAIKTAQKGLRTVCIHNEEQLGGVGVNWGCIPSKAMLEYTRILRNSQTKLKAMGIEAGPVKANFTRMQIAKEDAVTDCTNHIKDTFRTLGITHLKGSGKFAGTHEITVDMNDGGQENVIAKNIIVATGSNANALPEVGFDEEFICSSQGALTQEKIPKHMMIYGGGIVGIEIGSVYQRLGTDVTVVQRSDKLCTFLDHDVAQLYVKILKDQGMKFLVNTAISDATNRRENGIYLNMRNMTTKEEFVDTTDVLLVSIGRHANTEGLDVKKAKVPVSNRGVIQTNKNWQVDKQPHIYAVGDCAPGTMLVHKAEVEAIAVAEHISTGKGSVNYDCIPGVIYTSPEVAWIGKQEEELQQAGTPYNKGVFQVKKNFRASITHEDEGFVKVMTCPETHKFLGIWILGNNAGEMIAEGVAAFHNGATVQSVAETTHSHPTLSEAFRQACIATYDKPTIL